MIRDTGRAKGRVKGGGGRRRGGCRGGGGAVLSLNLQPKVKEGLMILLIRE